MKKKVLACIFVFSCLLLGCNKIPDEVRNYDSVITLVPISQVKKLNNKSKKITIDNKLYINSVISIPQNDEINLYEVNPIEYNSNGIFEVFGMNKNDFEIVQGGSSNYQDKNYELAVFESKDYTIIIDNKNGRINFCNPKIYNKFSDTNSEIPLENNNSDISLEQAQDMVDSIFEKLSVEFVINNIKSYRCADEDYYTFNMSQVIDGVRVDDEDHSYSDNSSIERHFIDVIINENGVVFFEARLCRIKQSKISYNELVSLDSAIEKIKRMLDLIMPSGTEFINNDGKVNINKIELIYVPQHINDSTLQYQLTPVWLFKSGSNVHTNRYCNIRINALTGELM